MLFKIVLTHQYLLVLQLPVHLKHNRKFFYNTHLFIVNNLRAVIEGCCIKIDYVNTDNVTQNQNLIIKNLT